MDSDTSLAMYAGHQPSRRAIVAEAADGQSADRSGSLQLPLLSLKAGPAGRQRHGGQRATASPTNHPGWQLHARTALPSPAGTTFLLALLLKRQDLEFPGVVGMRPGVGCSVGVTETLLQLGRLLRQLDRSGMRRQLPALGQRSSLTGAGRVLVCLRGPTCCLAGFLEQVTSLLNGLGSQVPKALQGLVLRLIVPVHGRPTILDKPGRSTCPITSRMAGRSHSDNRLVATALGVANQPRFGLLCRGDAPGMTVLREGRRRGPNSEPLVRSFGNARTCAADGCATQLSRYNPAPCCNLHQGWDLGQRTRPRRPAPESPLPPTTANDRPAD
jgi:hypothetical protein